MKISLPDITLVAASSVLIDDTLSALKFSMRSIEFGAVKIISHERPKNLPSNIIFSECNKMRSLDEYSHFMMYDLIDHVDTPYCLTIQQDGFVIHPHKWDSVFRNYDYIGAPWPEDDHFRSPDGTMRRVGNGGFSFRSRKLLAIARDANIPFMSRSGSVHEDVMIAVEHRHIYEQYGCNFAPIEIAVRFAREFPCPESAGVSPFGFHKYHKNNKLFPKFPTLFQKLCRALSIEK